MQNSSQKPRPWGYESALVWPTLLQGCLEPQLNQRLTAAIQRLRPLMRATWEEGALLLHFLERAASGALIYPVAIMHGLVCKHPIYYDAVKGYHVIARDSPKTWTDHIEDAVVGAPVLQCVAACVPTALHSYGLPLRCNKPACWPTS